MTGYNNQERQCCDNKQRWRSFLSASYTIVMAIKLMAVKLKFETHRAVDEGYVVHDSMFLRSAEKFIPTLYIFLPSPAKAAA